MKYSRKKYESLADALDSIPDTAEEYEKQAQEDLENSSTLENQKEEAQEPTNKYEIRFVKYPKKQKQKSIQEKKNFLKGKPEKKEKKHSKEFLELLKRNPTFIDGNLEKNHPKGFQL